jgi:hypothetical protein
MQTRFGAPYSRLAEYAQIVQLVDGKLCRKPAFRTSMTGLGVSETSGPLVPIRPIPFHGTLAAYLNLCVCYAPIRMG